MLQCAAGALLIALLAGCERNEVKVYKLAKEDNGSNAQQPQSDAMSPAISPHGGGQTQLTWTLPEGWQQKTASEMRVASFAATGKNGETADVSVIPLPAGEPQLQLVNMWRQQLQLAPVSSEADGEKPETVTVGSDEGKLYDMKGEGATDGSGKRILVAMDTRGPQTWFFKMTGPDSLLNEQKAVFLQFLKSIKFEAGVDPMQFAAAHQFLSTNAKETRSENSEKPIWVVPPGWQELPPSQFLLAKFEASGAGGAKADVNVSMLAGSGGGLLANINRWRRQLGLGPVDEDGLTKLTTSVNGDGGKIIFVDMTGTDPKSGQPARMVGAVVPQSGDTWFYKLMGDDQVVAQQKDTFQKFVQTVKYPNAL